jgi:F-type H+-transporting ATPase subunit b
LINSAKETIHNEKMAAVTELKNQVGQISISIAEKILNKELAGSNQQEELIKNLIQDVKLN